MKVKYYKDSWGKWRWIVTDKAGYWVCEGFPHYTRKADARRGFMRFFYGGVSE